MSFSIKKMVKKVFYLVIAAMMLEVAGSLYGLQPSDIIYHYTKYQSDIELMNKNYSVSVVNGLDVGEQHKQNINGSLIVNEYDFSRFFHLMCNEIKKIPASVIENNLSNIHSFSSLFLNEMLVGGTYDEDKKNIYLNAFTKGGYRTSKRFTKKIFHHEFSSILMKNYNFIEKEWRKSLGEGFLYENDKNPFYFLVYLQGNADKIDEEVLYQRGLLRQYAETGLENDFNVYAEMIFVEPKKTKMLIAKYPSIKRKYEFFKQFYLDIDSGFSPIFKKIDG